MSCIAPTSIEYTTSLFTIHTSLYTTLTNLEPVAWAARTSADGLVYTPTRTVSVTQYVAVTSVIQRVEAVRTVIGSCEPTGVSAESTSRRAETAGAQVSSSTSSMQSIAPTSITPIPPPSPTLPSPSSTSVSPPSSLAPISTTSPERAGPTSFQISSSLSTPPRTRIDNFPNLSSASVGFAGPDTAFEHRLGPGAVGGLVVSGLAILAMVLVGLWYILWRSKGVSTEKQSGFWQGGGFRRWAGGGGWRYLKGSMKETPHVNPYTDKPLPKPVHNTYNHGQSSTSSTAPAVHNGEYTSTGPPTPINPYSASSPSSSLPNFRQSRLHLSSPTPASLSRDAQAAETPSRIGSVWSRMSGMGWQMGLWGRDSGSESAREIMVMKRDTAIPPQGGVSGAAVLDLFPTNDPASGQEDGASSISGLVWETEIIERDRVESGSGYRSSSGIDTAAPARPSSEYTRGEEDTFNMNEPAPRLPPILSVFDPAGRLLFPRFGAGAGDGDGHGADSRGWRRSVISPASPRKRSSWAWTGSAAASESDGRSVGSRRSGTRPLAGRRRSSISPTASSDNNSSTPSSASSTIFARPPTISDDIEYPLSPTLFPSPYLQPGYRTPTLPLNVRRSSKRSPLSKSHTRRPPKLEFAEEVGLPHLWLDEQGIAAFNPLSRTARRSPAARKWPTSRKGGEGLRGSGGSAYDGMMEVEVTPTSHYAAAVEPS